MASIQNPKSKIQNWMTIFPDNQVVSGLTLWQWQQQALASARIAGIAPDELNWLLQAVAGLDSLSLRLKSFKDCPQISLSLPLSELDNLWQKRISDRFPVQYIAGVTPWRHFALKVSPAVLIPRPETEIIIDLAAKTSPPPPLPHSPPPNWADLGTGSGAIALGLAQVFPHAIVHAVDISPESLAIARQNAQAHGYTDRIAFYEGSWFEPLEALKGQLDGMVSNPPYIPSRTIGTLQPEVAQHEPHLALDGGEDGLDYIRHLVKTAPDYLRSGGIWLIEMMAGQADAVAQLLWQDGRYDEIQIYPDLAGIERFALAYCR